MSLAIISSGAQTPAGLTLKATSAAFRAGLNAFVRPPYLRDRRTGAPVTVSMLESLEDARATARIKAFAQAAAHESYGPLQAITQSVRFGFLLNLPEERPTFTKDAAVGVARQVLESLPIQVASSHRALLQAGSAGLFALLSQAERLLRAKEVDVCLVGGADSHIDIDVLHWIEKCGRLKSTEQPNGVVPGEAAAFVVVCLPEFAEQNRYPPVCHIASCSAFPEPNPWYTRRSTLGQGLTRSLQNVFRITSQQANCVYAELNGESWRADEWGYAYLRTASYYRNPLTVLHPANCLGETGAATGALLIGLAGASLARDSGTGKAVAVWSASATLPLRGACQLQKV